MANVGRLNVDLVARTGQFSKGLRQASTGIRGFQQNVTRMSGLLKGALAFAGITAGVYSLIRALGNLKGHVKQSFEDIDKLAKSADKLSITTEQLAGLGLAASITGTDIGALDKGMERLQRSISEAATGTGEAVDTLKEMGLNAVLLNQMLPYEQLLVVADAMSKMQNRTDQLRVSMELFGRGGAPLVNLLRTGAKGIQAFTSEAEDLGIAVSRVDAAKIEIANDAITRAGEALKGFYNTIAIAIAPGVAALANEMTRAFKEVQSAIGSAESGLGAIESAIRWIGDSYDKVRLILKTIDLYAERIVVKFRALTDLSIWNPSKNIEVLANMRQELAKIDAEMQGILLGEAFSSLFGGGTTGDRMVKTMEDVKKQAEDTANAIQFGAGNASLLADEAERGAAAYKGGMAQGNLAQAMGAVGQSGISAAASRMATKTLEYAQRQLTMLEKIETNTRNQGYAVAAPG